MAYKKNYNKEEYAKGNLISKIKKTERYNTFSDKGYEVDNIQWVYKPINIMKNGLSDSDFKDLCYKVSDFTRQS